MKTSLPHFILYFHRGHKFISDLKLRQYLLIQVFCFCFFPVPIIRHKPQKGTTVIEVAEGRDIKLPCQVRRSGDKILSYLWNKNNKTLYTASHPRMTVKLYRYLKIKKARKEDAGKYACLATNHCGTATFTLELYVNSKLFKLTHRSIVEIVSKETDAESVGN